MRIFGTILIVLLLASCAKNQSKSQTEDQINDIRNAYVKGWLVGDSETVMSLFVEGSVIIPSGMAPIKGKESIETYWFPKDSSKTEIHSYEVDLIQMDITDSIAHSLEKGVLNFTYTKDDFSMTKESVSYATTVYKKQMDGSWKIISRMWTQQK